MTKEQKRELDAYRHAWACELLGRSVESFKLDPKTGDLVIYLADSSDDRGDYIEARIAPMPAPKVDRW